MRIRSIFVFLGGAVVGSAAAALGLKKYYRDSYDKIYRQTIVDLEKQLKQVHEEKKREATVTKEEPKSEASKNSKDGPIEKTGVTIDYHKMSEDYIKANHLKDVKIDKVIDPAEREYPSDDEPVFYRGQRMSVDGPNEIDEELYTIYSPYIHSELEYYAGDGVLVDENNEPITDYSMILGDVLEESGFTQDSRDYIYISNPSISAMYSVHKKWGRYIDENE